MIDWTSPDELARESLVFDQLTHTLLGVYAWEWVISLDFDWQFITGQKRFRWPMIFYFLNRYFMLFSLIGIVIGLDVTSEINCQALYSFNTVIGACAIGLASINLSLRTMAVWSGRWYIVVPLTVIILGHFALLLQVVTLRATWIKGKGCVRTYTHNSVLAPTFIYTMIFDFIILFLTAVELFQTTTGSHSRLTILIFKDGLIYFIVAFLSNLVATTFILLNLNPIMTVIANVPAAIFSSIAACRVVRRLNDHSVSNPEVFSLNAQVSSMAFRTSMVRPSGPTMAQVRSALFVSPAPIEVLSYALLSAVTRPLSHQWQTLLPAFCFPGAGIVLSALNAELMDFLLSPRGTSVYRYASNPPPSPVPLLGFRF